MGWMKTNPNGNLYPTIWYEVLFPGMVAAPPRGPLFYFVVNPESCERNEMKQEIEV